jgi:CDP-glycerol glycerophosphotransferase
MSKEKLKNIFKLIFGIFFNFLLIFFSYLVFKNKNSLLFGSGNGKLFKGNPKYLYLYMLKHKNKFKKYKIIWITENKKIFKKLSQKKMPVIYKYSLSGFYFILKSRYIFIDQSAKDFSYMGAIWGRFNIIQTWHGTPLKKTGLKTPLKKISIQIFFKFFLKRELKKYKLFCSTSQMVSKTLSDSFENSNILITGYPRNDIFFNKNKKLYFENLNKKLNLNKYFKIISYIPTYRDMKINKQPFSKEYILKLNNYLNKRNYIFIIKKHPLFDKFFKNFKNLSNIKDFSDGIEDVQELLIYTDILITDYSSVFFDFCLTDKPIIYYAYDYEEYLDKCRGMYYDYYKELPGPFANNENELFNFTKINNLF